MKTTKYLSVMGLTVLFMAFTLSSCLKNKDGIYDDYRTAASVSIVHAAPKTGALDIAFNGTQRLNLDYFNYTDRVTYLPAYPGDRTIYVYHEGSWDSIFAKQIQLEPSKNYTIFIVDTLSKMDAVLIRDSSRVPGTDSVRIRFANMSPDAGAVDFYVQGQTTPVATNITFKNADNFISMKAANDVIFEVKAAGSGTVLATSEKKNLYTGNYYTIWTTGFKSMSGTPDKMIVESIRHY